MVVVVVVAEIIFSLFLTVSLGRSIFGGVMTKVLMVGNQLCGIAMARVLEQAAPSRNFVSRLRTGVLHPTTRSLEAFS